MARTRTITDEQILKAAQAIFLEKGFGASTLEIAKRAGVSEGSIFKRFNTKENLFLIAMGVPTMPPWIPFLEAVVGQGDLKGNLKILASKVFEFFRENLPKMQMILSNQGLAQTLGQSDQSPPVRNLKALTQFFSQEVALGRMQTDNPRTLAMMFMGSMMQYIFLKQMSAKLPEQEEYVNSMVEILWQSIRP
ncbi:MAG: TetR/AcrR family transcriptional regulator [Cyanobacteria bacterium P01_A01_bin.123]